MAAHVGRRGGAVSWSELDHHYIDRRGWYPEDFYAAVSDAERMGLIERAWMPGGGEVVRLARSGTGEAA